MRGIMLALCLLASGAIPAFAESSHNYFEDQLQYELLYEFTYQSNFVESLLLECTGERGVSYAFAFATAPISNNYKREILGVAGIAPDPFTAKPLSKRLWHELKLAVTRDPNDQGDLAEPVLMAQKDVLRLMEQFRDEKDVLCDFVFWEEVLRLDDVTVELMRDAKRRKADTPEFLAFDEEARKGLVVLTRLFQANPLKRSP